MRSAPLGLVSVLALVSPLFAAARLQVEQWVEPAIGIEYPSAGRPYLAGTRGLLFELAAIEFQGDETVRLTARDTDSGAEAWRSEDPFGVTARGLKARESDGALFTLSGRLDGSVSGGGNVLRRRTGTTGALEQELVLPYGGAFSGTMLELSSDGGTLIAAVPAGFGSRILAYDPDDFTLRWEAVVGFGSTGSASFLSVSSDGRVVAVAGVADDENDPTNTEMVWGCVDGDTASVVWSKRDLTPGESGFSTGLTVAMIRGEDGITRYRVHTIGSSGGNKYYVQDGLRDRTIREGGILKIPQLLVDDERGVVLHGDKEGNSLVVRSALTGKRIGARGVPPGVSVSWVHDRRNSTVFGFGAKGEGFVSGAGNEIGLLNDLETGRMLWASEAPEPLESFQRGTVVGPALGGTTRYVLSSTGSFFDPPLKGAAYRVRESDGKLGARFEQLGPQEAPAAPVAFSPSPAAGGWCALLVSQPLQGDDDLPTAVDLSLLQRLRRFDPATGAVLEDIDLPSGGRDARAAFAFGGNGLLVADRIETAPFEEPVRVRALEVATGEVFWSTELRPDARTPRGVVQARGSEACVVAWSDSPVQGLNRVGLSFLDAEGGEVVSHGFVDWAHPDGDQLRMRTLTGPLVPGGGDRVLVAGEPNDSSSSSMLQVAAYAPQGGALLWAREVDLPAAFPNSSIRLGTVAADPDHPWLWVSGTVQASVPPGTPTPFLARVDATDGSLAFATAAPADRIGAFSGLELQFAEPAGWLEASRDDAVLHATSLATGGAEAKTSWVTAFSKLDGTVRWSRVLDPVKAPVFPLGLAASPTGSTVVVYGAREFAPGPSPLEFLKNAASAATWIDVATGKVVGDVVGSEADGSRWIAGAVDGSDLLLSEVRRAPSEEQPRARLSRWSMNP